MADVAVGALVSGLRAAGRLRAFERYKGEDVAFGVMIAFATLVQGAGILSAILWQSAAVVPEWYGWTMVGMFCAWMVSFATEIFLSRPAPRLDPALHAHAAHEACDEYCSLLMDAHSLLPGDGRGCDMTKRHGTPS